MSGDETGSLEPGEDSDEYDPDDDSWDGAGTEDLDEEPEIRSGQ